MEKHDLPKLEKSIKDLSHTLTALADNRDLEELLRIIHNPGWTTPAEFAFASAIVNSMHVQARALTELKQNLVNASRRVGAKSAGA